MGSRVRIVLTGSLANYPQGGGNSSVFVQYLWGLQALGHDVYWLDQFPMTEDSAQDQRLVHNFLRRARRIGFGDRCAVLMYNEAHTQPTLESVRIVGMNKVQFVELARSTDLLWNFCASLPRPLLLLFPRRILIDLDPGILQASALTWDLGIADHHSFLTVGSKLHDPDCGVPTLGVTWRRFRQPVYLPMWPVAPVPSADAPFTSITEWTWDSVGIGERLLSASKRDAYLPYLELPQRTGRAFELAANIDPEDPTNDREVLLSHGWRLVDPHRAAGSPSAYRHYIQRARAEIGCTRPIYVELRTGWFSDRSACYLASGRPVLVQDTGMGDYLPTGTGLVVFQDMEEAVAGVAAIDRDYARHRQAARTIADEFFEAGRCLTTMLDACN